MCGPMFKVGMHPGMMDPCAGQAKDERGAGAGITTSILE